MKRILSAALLALVAISATAAGNDIVFTKRNAADTAQGPLTPPHPTTSPGIMYVDHVTFLPGYLYLGPGLSITGATLDVVTPTAVTWATLTGKPAWTGVFDGSYTSLTGRPTLFSGAYADLTGKPTLFSGAYADLSGVPSTFTPSAHTHPASEISDSTSTGRAVLTASSTSAARAAIGAGTSSFSGNYGDLSSVPSAFTPSAHTHAITDVTGLQAALNGKAASATTLAGYGITDGVTSSSLSSTLSGYATTSALTTGLSGKFNTPSGTTAQYVRGDGTLATLPSPGSGTVTSVTAGAGLSGGTITTSGTISLPNTGTAGTYNSVTTDAQGRVTAGANTKFDYSYPAAKTIVTGTSYQSADTTKASVITYSAACANNSTVLAANPCTLTLRMANTTATCSTGTVYATLSATVDLGLVITQRNTTPGQVMMPIGANVIFCATAGTWTITAVEQAAS